MATYEVTRATQAHADALKNCLRKRDIEEVWASHRVTPAEAVQRGFDLSSKCWVALEDHEPTMIFGVAPVGWLSKRASPWLLSSDRIYRMKKYFLAHSQEYVDYMIEDYQLLHNWVDARNKASIRWLKWLGFTVEPPIPHGYDNLPFHYFWKRNNNHV